MGNLLANKHTSILHNTKLDLGHLYQSSSFRPSLEGQWKGGLDTSLLQALRVHSLVLTLSSRQYLSAYVAYHRAAKQFL